MSGHLERLKRLEMKVPERAELSGPAAAWAAVLWGKGTPRLVARACRPYLAELQIKLLSHEMCIRDRKMLGRRRQR